MQVEHLIHRLAQPIILKYMVESSCRLNFYPLPACDTAFSRKLLQKMRHTIFFSYFQVLGTGIPSSDAPNHWTLITEFLLLGHALWLLCFI